MLEEVNEGEHFPKTEEDDFPTVCHLCTEGNFDARDCILVTMDVDADVEGGIEEMENMGEDEGNGAHRMNILSFQEMEVDGLVEAMLAGEQFALEKSPSSVSIADDDEYKPATSFIDMHETPEGAQSPLESSFHSTLEGSQAEPSTHSPALWMRVEDFNPEILSQSPHQWRLNQANARPLQEAPLHYPSENCDEPARGLSEGSANRKDESVITLDLAGSEVATSKSESGFMDELQATWDEMGREMDRIFAGFDVRKKYPPMSVIESSAAEENTVLDAPLPVEEFDSTLDALGALETTQTRPQSDSELYAEMQTLNTGAFLGPQSQQAGEDSASVSLPFPFLPFCPLSPRNCPCSALHFAPSNERVNTEHWKNACIRTTPAGKKQLKKRASSEGAEENEREEKRRKKERRRAKTEEGVKEVTLEGGVKVEERVKKEEVGELMETDSKDFGRVKSEDHFNSDHLSETDSDTTFPGDPFPSRSPQSSPSAPPASRSRAIHPDHGELPTLD